MPRIYDVEGIKYEVVKHPLSKNLRYVYRIVHKLSLQGMPYSVRIGTLQRFSHKWYAITYYGQELELHRFQLDSLKELAKYTGN